MNRRRLRSGARTPLRVGLEWACAVGICVASAPIPALAQQAGGTFRIHASGIADSTVTAVAADLTWAEDRITETLGAFPDTVSVRIFAGRETFTAALREAWGIPETACWMVGGADDHSLYLLSPDVWETEACEHDTSDAVHRRRLIAHEAVHVYHGQVNPSADIGLLEEIGWFVEGLATFVSGQLETSHAGRAAEAIETDAAPVRLEDGWSGPYRYGVSGSMAEFIDVRWGRDTLLEALLVTSEAELLGLLGLSEEAFLEEWAAWVRP